MYARGVAGSRAHLNPCRELRRGTLGFKCIFLSELAALVQLHGRYVCQQFQ